MKKRRLLSFISALVLLGATNVVHAQEAPIMPANAVYYWVSPTGTVYENGGTIVYTNGDGERLNYSNANYYSICLNGKKANMTDEAASANAGYMLLTLNEALQEGDQIVATGYRNKNAEGKTVSIYALFENGTDVTYSDAFTNICSDEANADYDNDGSVPTTNVFDVPAAAAGSKTIKLTRGSASTNLFLTQFVVTRGAAAPIYSMVTDATDLVAGEKYVIMAQCGDGYVALSDQSGSYRVPSDTIALNQYAFSVVPAKTAAAAPATFAGVPYEVTLQGETGAWVFNDAVNAKNLSWTSGNSLTLDETGSTWTISFDEYSFAAKINLTATPDRALQYNAGSPRFACYTSVQKDVYLFKAGDLKVAPRDPITPSFASIDTLLKFKEGYVVELALNAAIDSVNLEKHYLYISDATGAIQVYDYNIPAEYAAFGKLTGTVKGTYGSYKGTKQLSQIDYTNVVYTAPVEVESPWTGSVIAGGESYYLYNVKADAYLTGGNSWGTQASFGAPGVQFIATGEKSLFAFDGPFSNGGNNHFLGNNLYVDASSYSWAVEQVGDKVYTIKYNDGSNFIGYKGNSVVGNIAELDDACYWQFISKAERSEKMAAAAANNAVDATFLVAGSNFGRNDANNKVWANLGKIGGDNSNQNMEKWSTAAFDINQTLTDIPNGTYLIKFDGFYRFGGPDGADTTHVQGTEELAAKWYANNDTVSIISIIAGAGKAGNVGTATSFGYVPNSQANATTYFTAGAYVNEGYCIVTDGTLKLGFFKNFEKGNDWMVVDNVRLAYYGTATPAEILTAELAAISEEVNGLITAAQAMTDSMSVAASTQLAEALKAAQDAVATPTKENLAAAKETLSNAIAVAQYSMDFIAWTINAAPTANYTMPVSATQWVVNANMSLGTKGWATTFAPQGSSYPNFDQFLETWVNNADLGNVGCSQTIIDMPNGVYRLKAACLATRQGAEDPKAAVSGVYLYMNGDSVAVATLDGKPEYFSVETTVTDGVITLGIAGVGATANWMGWDNVTLEYLGADRESNYIGEKGKLVAIPEGNYYIFYTDAEGAKHYLYAAGTNTWTVVDSPKLSVITNGNVENGSYASAASFMNNNHFLMSNAANSDGSGAIKTEAEDGNNAKSKRTWDCQVYYLDAATNLYAIRLTNATGTGWGANCFVNIDPATLAVSSGNPSLGDALLLWSVVNENDPSFSTGVLLDMADAAEKITGIYNKEVKATLDSMVIVARAASAADVETVKVALQAAMDAATASIADYVALNANAIAYEPWLVEGAAGSTDLKNAIATAKAAYTDLTATSETLAALNSAYTAYMTANEVAGLVNGTFVDGVKGWTTEGAAMKTGNHNKWTNINDQFVEQWAGAPTALADFNFYQVVKGLPAGKYTVSAYAQACLQSEDDTYMVKGVKFYVNGDSVDVHTINIDRNAENSKIGATLYIFETTIAAGDSLKIGLSVASTDANWVVIDNVKLFCFDPAVAMAVKLEEANKLLTENPSVLGVHRAGLTAQVDAHNDIDALSDAISAFKTAIAPYGALKALVDEYAAVEVLAAAVAEANAVLASATATLEEVNEAYTKLDAAVLAYRISVATVAYPCDMSRYLVNPNMTDGKTGWTNDMATQGANYSNGDVKIEQFLEKWVSGAALGSAYCNQTVTGLPNGFYRMTADVIATRQDNADPKGFVEGAYIYMNNDSVAVATGNGAPERFSVYATVTDGTIVLGFAGVNLTANWVCFDNVKLEFCGRQMVLGYMTAVKTMDEGATVDPIYTMLSKEPTIKLVQKDVTTDAIDLSEFDAIIIQEAIGGKDASLKPAGALALDAITVPVLYNKTYALQSGRATDNGTPAEAGEGVFNLTITKESDIFKGLTGENVKMFYTGATDGGSAGTKALNYVKDLTGVEGTMVAYPEGKTDAVLAINDIPAGSVVGGKTLQARMISFDMNYGAICQQGGKYMTDANYTIWRNAVYSLLGLDVPATAIDMAINDECDVTGITLNTASVKLAVGETYTLTATVIPETAVNKTVLWTSSNETIATVANGVITAVGYGDATITATTADGKYSATCTVTIAITEFKKWDFRAWSAETITNMKAGDEWIAVSYYRYKTALDNAALLANGVEVAEAKDLLFTATTGAVRIYASETVIADNYILLNAAATVTVPASAGDTIYVSADKTFEVSGATALENGYVVDGANVSIQFAAKTNLYYIDLAKAGTGISAVEADAVVSRTYYNVNGTVIAEPAKGINIMKTTFVDGSVKVQKVYVK